MPEDGRVSQERRTIMRTVYVCRETSRRNGTITISFVGINLEDSEIFALMLRQKLHPELRYFIALEREYYLHKCEIEEMLCRETIPSKEVLAEYFVAPFPLN